MSDYENLTGVAKMVAEITGVRRSPTVSDNMVERAVKARGAYWNSRPLPSSDAGMDRMETAAMRAALTAALSGE